jgi:kynureninase
MEKGIKHDEGKQEWFAMPLIVLQDLADVFNAGEKEYAIFNCLNTFDEPDRRFYNALMRHLTAAQIDPLAKDEGTGCYHLAQVAFNALMRLHHCKKREEIKFKESSSGAKIIKQDFQVLNHE